MLATDGTNTNAAEWENAGLRRRLANHFDDFSHIEAGIKIGGVFNREMRHVGDHSNDSKGRSKRGNEPAVPGRP